MDRQKGSGGPVGRAANVFENRAALYPLPTVSSEIKYF